MVKENIFRKKKDLLKILLEQLSAIEIENVKNLVGLYYTSAHSFTALYTEDYFTVAIQSIERSDPEIALINNVDRIVIQNAREKVIAAILFLKPELLTFELIEYCEQVKVYKDLIDHKGLLQAQEFITKYKGIEELIFLTELFKSYLKYNSVNNYFFDLGIVLSEAEINDYNRAVRDYLKGKKWKGFSIVSNRALFGFTIRFKQSEIVDRINDLFYLALNTNLSYLDRNYSKLQRLRQFIQLVIEEEFRKFNISQLKYYQEIGICSFFRNKNHRIIISASEIKYIEFLSLEYKTGSGITLLIIQKIFTAILNKKYSELDIYKNHPTAFTEAVAVIKAVLVTRFNINIDNLNLILNTRFETILQSLRESLSQES